MRRETQRKEMSMASYVIQINEKTRAGQSLFEYLTSLGVVIEQLKPHRKCGLDEALDDVKHGRVYHAESAEDMFTQILGKDYVQH